MLNKIYNEDCLDTMSKMNDCYIDLVLTSPPYDNIREYNGFTFDYKSVIKNMYRVVKDGGVVVWVVGDKTHKGSETCTSFKQALFFREVGFKLHDTMIYYKNFRPGKFPRYYQEFEYMFVFCKGKIKTFNPIMVKTKGYKTSKATIREGDKLESLSMPETEYRKRGNVWKYNVGFNKTTKDKIAFKHPAIFPDKLAEDHIISWSNEKDIVYDPFMGSGTTAKMCIKNNRHYIGSEVSKEYCDIIEERLNVNK